MAKYPSEENMSLPQYHTTANVVLCESRILFLLFYRKGGNLVAKNTRDGWLSGHSSPSLFLFRTHSLSLTGGGAASLFATTGFRAWALAPLRRHAPPKVTFCA